MRVSAASRAFWRATAWAMRALVRYDRHLFDQIHGVDVCQRMGAALKGAYVGTPAERSFGAAEVIVTLRPAPKK